MISDKSMYVEFRLVFFNWIVQKKPETKYPAPISCPLICGYAAIENLDNATCICFTWYGIG